MKINWFEIPVADIDRAQLFYETIFDTKMERLQLGEEFHMALFHAAEGDTQSGALCQHPQAYHPSDKGSLLFLDANPDMSSIADRIEAAGGKLLIGKRQISEERGYMAVFTDTEGNRVALQSRQ